MSNKRYKIIAAICIVVCLFLALYIYASSITQQPAESAAYDAALVVTVIDVGQGDSILVTHGDDTMLIDAASKASADAVLKKLREQRIEDIDFLVATHPHEDHIGGIVSVIENYKVGAVYMADTRSDSKTYKKLMSVIEAEDIPVIEAYAGIEFSLGAALCTIVSPARDAEHDANNESIVIFLDYLDSEFLFTGDMERKAEKELIKSGFDFDADVLKVAHHGSSTGTSEAFLKIASPEYAVISCGEGNSYRHPHEETLFLLGEYEADILRTDISGGITFISDGKTIIIKLEKAAAN